MSSRNLIYPTTSPTLLYQIGIRCLVATAPFFSDFACLLYQIGIRCLVATGFMKRLRRRDIISNWN